MASSTTSGLTLEQPAPAIQTTAPVRLPRVAIQFCTQCKWMLRAAYFAQELLSTFGPTLGEIALQPATGGIFTVTIETADTAARTGTGAPRLLWDRKTDGGFPETKELKRRVRDVIEPGRDLGHVDRNYGKSATTTTEAKAPMATAPLPPAVVAVPVSQPKNDDGEPTVPVCEDCQ